MSQNNSESNCINVRLYRCRSRCSKAWWDAIKCETRPDMLALAPLASKPSARILLTPGPGFWFVLAHQSNVRIVLRVALIPRFSIVRAVAKLFLIHYEFIIFFVSRSIVNGNPMYGPLTIFD